MSYGLEVYNASEVLRLSLTQRTILSHSIYTGTATSDPYDVAVAGLTTGDEWVILDYINRDNAGIVKIAGNVRLTGYTSAAYKFGIFRI